MQFDSALRMGKMGEGLIATWLRRTYGYNVLPVYEKEIHEGKGPVLYTIDDTLIAPDLLVFNTRKVFWIEAKTKSAFTWHRCTQRWVTGIDLRHYEDYRRVAACSPWPVWLLFLHLEGQAKDSPAGCPTGLFGGEIGYLVEHENHRHGNWGSGGMVYWSTETLKYLASLKDVIKKEAHATT